MHPESYYINRINKLKEHIKELDKQQEDYEAERNSILNYIDELQYNLYKAQAETWCNDAYEGKHKHITYAELPEYVRQELYSFIDKHKQGCEGSDEECKKCGQMCIAKGYEEFKKKYNIETIQW